MPDSLLARLRQHSHRTLPKLSTAELTRSSDTDDDDMRRHASPSSPAAPSASLLHQLLYPRERARRKQLSVPQPSPYSALVARDLANDRKNRYSDVVPYDRTRVKVVGDDGPAGYLNASWIEELDGKRRWVAAQAPTPATMFTFFLHFLTSSSHVLVQLTAPVESGVKKSDPYLPSADRESTFSSPDGRDVIRLRFVKQEWREDEKCSVTTLDAVYGEETKRITQVYFAGWKDKGVPEGREGLETLLRLIKLVDKLNVQDQAVAGEQSGLGPPIVVHCSAGVGRTGSYISLASLARLLASRDPFPDIPPSPVGQLPAEVAADPVARVIDALREQRCMSVETREQVGLVWDGRRVLEEQLQGA